MTPSVCKLLSEQGFGFRKANVIECCVFLFAIYNSALHSLEGKSIFPGNNAAEAMAFDISSAQWPVPPSNACACACASAFASALTRTQHCSTSKSSCGSAHGIDFNPLLKLEISLTSRRSALKKKDVSRFELGLIQTQITRTRTRTNTNPNDTEANAAGRSVRECVARKSKSYYVLTSESGGRATHTVIGLQKWRQYPTVRL